MPNTSNHYLTGGKAAKRIALDSSFDGSRDDFAVSDIQRGIILSYQSRMFHGAVISCLR